MAKGVFVANAVHTQGGPGFITGARRARLKLEIQDRLWTFRLGGSGVIHILRLRAAAGGPLTVGAGLGVWWFSCSNVRAPRARRVLKAVKNAATEVLSMQQLRDDTRPVAATVRASPDLRRAIAWDTNGAPTTWDTYLVHTIFEHDHPAEAHNTTAAEIDGAAPEPLSAAAAIGVASSRSV